MRNKLFIQTLLLEVLLLSVSVVSASAYDFEVDGIYYNILSEKQKTVEVTYKDSIFDFPSQRWYYYRFSNDYSGDIIVPSIVEYNGQNYTVKRIGNYAFFSGEIKRTAALGDYINTVYKDHTITSIVLPPTLESIGYMSFAYTDISSIEIPSNVTYCYGKWNLRGMEDKFNPFMWCKVNKVVINDNAIMPPYVFYGCGVDTLVLGENVTFVDADDCPPFTGELALSFLEHVETLPIKAFHNWTCLYDVSLPPKMSHIPESLFSGAVNLTELKLSKGIKSIGKQAFRGLSIRSIDIPEGLKRIEDYAFADCSLLNDVHIPGSLTYLGTDVFSGCSSLTQLKLSKGIKSIGKQAFRGLSIRSIDIPEGLERIEDYAFADCSLLNDVHIPGSLTYLGKYAFSGCSSLALIKLPEGLERIDDYAFADCSLLNDVHIPGSLTYLGKYAFSSCSGLTQITLPTGLSKLEDYVFQSCSFDSIDLPQSLTSIGSGVFQNCVRLKNVILPSELKAIEGATFSGCSSLEKIDIPMGVTMIGVNAFSGCQSLKTISIPAWATISSYAFQHCANLETITIPDRISNYAFAGCNNLKEIYINNPLVTPIDEEAFTTSAYNYATLYVPVGTSDLYSRRMGWRNFFFIKEWDAPDYIEENVKEISSLQIEANGGVLIIQSISNGIPVAAYNVEGAQVGYAVSVDGKAVVYTNLQKGDVAIVKIGQQTKRVIMK